MVRTISLAPVLLVLAALATTGCRQQPDGYSISGKVTYQGKPVPRGTLLLRPDSQKGNSGPGVLFDIVDGAYETTSENRSVHQGGAYKVQIHGFDGNAKPSSELPLGQMLFSNYSTSVELPNEEATGIDFEVKK
ncbi:hypothetical protein M4951_09255 [Blastopirellula sp. J2-11]|uniref:hypothetical protein n=1 Tax=Blastopirellula sp. J2-11 TaxID=2943192 RepID=UPI0021C6D7B5|nr:hypothetical protein [Blastopirellula sp. J2-11]UUO08489.1 hypothetical protein M4951_09255 [Blastopirellula sp. J2-11]